MPSNNSTGSTTVATASEIAESHVPADQPAPISPIHTTTFRRKNLLSPSRRLAESDIPACRREAAAMEPGVSISFRLVRKLGALSSNQHHLDPVRAPECSKGAVFR